jgi:hypothetical protein
VASRIVGGVGAERRTLHIAIDVHVDREPIEGWVTAGAATARGFTGWIALAHEIEQARDAAKAERASADD